MSKRKKQKSGRTNQAAATNTEATATVATPKVKAAKPNPEARNLPLVFGKDTYIWLGAGFGVIVLGFLFMLGGRGDDPTVFDEDVIYSFRKITLAPILILTGLGLTTYAIFKK